jgi:hypothetical protein
MVIYDSDPDPDSDSDLAEDFFFLSSVGQGIPASAFVSLV